MDHVSLTGHTDKPTVLCRANDYIHNTGHSDYRAVLLNNVVVGKGRKLRQDDPTLTQAPAGFDSVCSFQYLRATVTDYV